MDSNAIESRIDIIENIYVALIALSILHVAFTALNLSGKWSNQEVLTGILALYIQAITLWGLKARKKWVVYLILIVSASMILRMLFVLVQPALDLKFLFWKIVSLLILLFYGYQLFFFPKSNIRNFFGVKGKVLY